MTIKKTKKNGNAPYTREKSVIPELNGKRRQFPDSAVGPSVAINLE
jgi:hypothetical protein